MQELDLRKRLFIIFGLIGLGIGLVFLFFFLRRASAPTENLPAESPVITDVAPGAVREPASPLSQPAAVDNPDEIFVLQLSRIFVERFYSYSNQNDNRHLADALALSTSQMAQWVRTQSVAQGETYSGVTTRVVASSVSALSAGAATVLVDVQQEQSGGEGNEIGYRSGRVELVKLGQEWRVNGFFWEET